MLSLQKSDDAVQIVGIYKGTRGHKRRKPQAAVYFTHTEVYPDTLRVPLIMSWPGCPEGARVGAPVTNVGIGRSLLSAAGLGGVEFPGEDLLVYAEGGGSEEPLYAFSFGAQSVSVTWRDRHLILHLKGHPIGDPAPLWVSQDCQDKDRKNSGHTEWSPRGPPEASPQEGRHRHRDFRSGAVFAV